MKMDPAIKAIAWAIVALIMVTLAVVAGMTILHMRPDQVSQREHSLVIDARGHRK